MSRLDKLIEKLCPDGVEMHELQELFITRNGYTPSKSKSEFWKNGTVPWFKMEDIRANGNILSDALQHVNECAVKGQLFPENSIIVATSATVGEHALITVPSLANQRFTYLMVKPEYEDKFVPKFLFYYCYKLDEYCLQNLNQSSFASVDMKKFAKFKFPVPPLEVQREIVRVLDSFTLLTAELTAELTARKKQYEFYRDKLLTTHNNVEMVELGTVCDFVRGPFGGALKKEIFQPDGYAVYEQQHAIYRNLDFRYFIDERKFSELKRFSVAPGDMIVSCSGTIGKTFVIPEGAPKGVINQALLKLTPKENLDVFYLQYFFENTISKTLNGAARGGAIKNVPSVSELKAIKFPLPPIDVQHRLVNVLDNFESICTDLNIGLPAEIEARQKQYEYYRDLLLTFAETGNTLLTDRQTDRQTERN